MPFYFFPLISFWCGARTYVLFVCVCRARIKWIYFLLSGFVRIRTQSRPSAANGGERRLPYRKFGTLTFACSPADLHEVWDIHNRSPPSVRPSVLHRTGWTWRASEDDRCTTSKCWKINILYWNWDFFNIVLCIF